MAETLRTLPETASRRDRYAALVPQLRAIVAGESDAVANMANIVAAVWQTFRFFWVGIYLARGDELVLGPFQGPIACTRIPNGRGVCGTAWREARVIVVPDVARFPGHIACSGESRSEIVVPVRIGDRIVAVIDVDSEHLDDFGPDDAAGLTDVAELLGEVLSRA